MDKRIAIPAGLALMVAMAVVGMLSLLSWTAPQPAEADISPATKIQYRMSNRGLGETSVHTIGPFQTTVALDTTNNIRLVYPTGHGFTLPSTGASVKVNTVVADAATVTGDTLDIDLGTQSIAAGTDITVELSNVTNTSTFNENLIVTVSDGTVVAPGTPLGAAVGTTQPLPISPLTQPVLQTGFLPSALQNPIKPGAQAAYTFSFITPSNLRNGIDEIVITFADDYQIPTSIDRNQVSISADAVLKSDGTAGGSANEAVAPLEVSVDFVSFQGSEQDEGEITVRVPDMASGDVAASVGGNGIQAGAKVTIIFRQSAGIKNPTESSSQRIDLRTSQDAGDIELVNPVNGKRVFTPVILELSSEGDPRGENLTVVALGVEGNKTSTFWLDQNGDGVRQSTERDLCNVVAASSDVATCSFNISNPPFSPGTVAAGGSCTVGAMVGCNFINVVDGENRTTTGKLAKSPFGPDEVSRQTFELEPSVSPSPQSVNVGDTVTISLFDYTAGTLGAKSIFIAGLDATPAGFSQTVPSSGERSFGFKIPGKANNGARIPTGTQRLEVFGAGGQGSPGVESQDTNIVIGGARLTLSHASIVANQDLTITGSGFTEGNNVCVVEGDVTINNVPVEIDDADDCPAATSAVDGILLSSGGTFTMTVRVEDRDIPSNTPINTALLTEGTVELKVIDTSGAEGTLQVDILPREISVNPLAARPRDVVTIIGRAFVADNSDGVSTTVNVVYQCGVDSRSVTADPDASGNFRETLRIPSNCSIPSTNTVTATINANGDTGVVETVTHEIPDALVRIAPVRGAPGEVVTVSGEGFRTFETVGKIEFGDLGVLGGRTVNTDGNGDFTVTDIVVPGEDPGIHAVKIEVGTGTNRTTASTSFEILEASGFGGAATTAIEEALAPLFEENTLDRVFFFNNVTKEWNFFINDDAFSSANDLDDIASGRPLWIKVTEDTSVELNGQPFDLTCVNPGTPEEDCWNLIVFP